MQEELFFDDPQDALIHTVRLLGGFSAVAAELWPAKTLKASENWLRDCLSHDRAAKLEYHEIIRIMKMGRERGAHCAFYTLCEELGYENPRMITPKTEEQKLADQFQRQAKEIAATADKLAALRHREKTRNEQ